MRWLSPPDKVPELRDKGLIMSDTGWRRIHPRSDNTEMIPEGGILSIINKRRMNLKGNLVGNVTATNMLDHEKFPWMHNQRGTKLHFDGHIAADGCSPWSHRDTNMISVGNDYDVKDISFYISSDPARMRGYGEAPKNLGSQGHLKEAVEPMNERKQKETEGTQEPRNQ